MRPQRVGPLLHVPEQSGRGIGQGGMVPPVGIGCCRRGGRRRCRCGRGGRYHRPTRQGHVGDAAPQGQELRPALHDGVEGAVGQFHGELRRGDGPRASAATGTGANRLGQCRHRRRAGPGQLGGGKLGGRCCRCGIIVGSSSSRGVAARPTAAAAAAAAEGRPLGRLDGIEQGRRQLDQADGRGGPVGRRADGWIASSSPLGGMVAADHDLDGVSEGGGAGTSAAAAASAVVRGQDVGAQTFAAGAGRPLAVDPDGQLGTSTVLSATVIADLVGEEAGNDGRSSDRHLGGGRCLLLLRLPLLLLLLLLLLDEWGDHRPTTGTPRRQQRWPGRRGRTCRRRRRGSRAAQRRQERRPPPWPSPSWRENENLRK